MVIHAIRANRILRFGSRRIPLVIEEKTAIPLHWVVKEKNETNSNYFHIFNEYKIGHQG